MTIEEATHTHTRSDDGGDYEVPCDCDDAHATYKDAATKAYATMVGDNLPRSELLSIQRGLAEAERGQTVRRDDLLTP